MRVCGSRMVGVVVVYDWYIHRGGWGAVSSMEGRMCEVMKNRSCTETGGELVRRVSGWIRALYYCRTTVHITVSGSPVHSSVHPR